MPPSKTTPHSIFRQHIRQCGGALGGLEGVSILAVWQYVANIACNPLMYHVAHIVCRIGGLYIIPSVTHQQHCEHRAARAFGCDAVDATCIRPQKHAAHINTSFLAPDGYTHRMAYPPPPQVWRLRNGFALRKYTRTR